MQCCHAVMFAERDKVAVNSAVGTAINLAVISPTAITRRSQGSASLTGLPEGVAREQVFDAGTRRHDDVDCTVEETGRMRIQLRRVADIEYLR